MKAYKNTSYLCNVFIVALVLIFSTSISTDAGILSGLAKLGKAAKKVDVDAPGSVIRKIDIPDAYKNLNTTDLIPNSSGSFDIRLADGRRASLDTLIASGEDLSQHALMIRSIDVPSELSYFDSIPNGLPVLISNRNQQVFELVRSAKPNLKYKNINIPLSTSTSIRTALYNFDKPLLASNPRFISLSRKKTNPLPENVYASKSVLEKTSADTLLFDLDKIKNQSIVLSGKISDGKLHSGKQAGFGVSISELTELAAKNDINLVILESSKPESLLKHLAKKQDLTANNISTFNQSTGDFINQLSDSKNISGLELSFSSSGKSQVAISTKTDNLITSTNVLSLPDSKSGNILAPTILRLLAHSIRIYRPDEVRSLELADIEKEFTRQKNKEEFRQLLPWLYTALSVFTGFWAIEYVNQLWRRIWPKPDPQKYNNRFIHGLLQASRFIFYLLLLLPLVGLPCAIFKFFKILLNILVMIKNLFVIIFISPIKWVIGKFN